MLRVMARKALSVSIPDVLWEQWLGYCRERTKDKNPPPTLSAVFTVTLTEWLKGRKKNET